MAIITHGQYQKSLNIRYSGCRENIIGFDDIINGEANGIENLGGNLSPSGGNEAHGIQ